MSPTYRKSRRAKLLERSRKGVEARERKRLAFDPDRESWRVVRTFLCRLWAAPDGRTVAIYVDGMMVRCGSERAVRAALAKMIYARKPLVNHA